MEPTESFRERIIELLLAGDADSGADEGVLVPVLIVNLEKFNLEVNWSIDSVADPLLRAILNAAATVITLVAS